MPDCLVCQELQGDVAIPGGFVADEPLVVAFHLPPLDANPKPYIGHLLVVTRRHVARFGDLTEDESRAVGRLASRMARTLIERGGAEWVYSAIIGIAIPHFHQHILPRYPGTPPDVRWYAIDEWEGGPHGGFQEIQEFVTRLTA